MAITVKQAPQASGYVSAHEDVWHLVDSTNKSTPGFKYVFYIKKNGVTLAKIVNSPYSAYNLLGALNVGNIVRTLPKFSSLYDLALPGDFRVNSADATEFFDDYLFSDYEVWYSEICGTVETYSTSGEYRVYNTYNRHPIHNADLELNNDYKSFLTNRPDTSSYYVGEPIVICMKMKTNAGVKMNYFIQNGIETKSYGLGLFADDGYRRLNLNGFNQNEATITARTIQPPTTTDYQTKKFIKKCSKYEVYTLVFINAFGCWDSFTFHSGEITTENEKKRYDLNNWKIYAAFPTDYISDREYNSSVYNEKTSTYATEFKTKMKLTSDILNSEEYKWLFELIVSPLVYIYDKNNTALHPVYITDTNYQIKNSLKNKTEFLEVNIEIDKQNTQFR
jgi:hypothetical protein